jgi:hypothetical protein
MWWRWRWEGWGAQGQVDVQPICDDRSKPIETVEAGEIEPDPEE